MVHLDPLWDFSPLACFRPFGFWDLFIFGRGLQRTERFATMPRVAKEIFDLPERIF